MILLLALAASISDCGNQNTTHEINRCLETQLRERDAELTREYARAVRAAKAADLTLDKRRDTRPGYYANLLKAERAWIVWRDAHCTEEGDKMRGGSGSGTAVLACLVDQTETRIRQLKGD